MELQLLVESCVYWDRNKNGVRCLYASSQCIRIEIHSI